MKNLRHLLRRSGWLSSETRRRRLDRSRSGVTRRLSNETLEKRQLLAGDFALAHNYWAANDVDDNRSITAKDALMVINHLNRHGSGHEITESDQASSFVDVNADHQVTAIDALTVINALNLGETEVHELIELHLNARDQNDNLIEPGADGSVGVTVGEVFNLEVGYQDLRDFTEGAFKLLTDLTFDPSSPIMPAVHEGQELRVGADIISESGTISFSLEGAPGETVEVDLDDFPSSLSGVAEGIEDILVQLGYSADEVEARVKLVRDQEFQPETYRIEIRYHGNDLLFEDLPALLADVSATNPVPTETLEFEPLNPDGTVNSAAVRWNLEFSSRTLNDEPVYSDFFFGGYSEATGFDDIGGQSAFRTTGIPFDFNEPFDAFSVPVVITEPVTDLVAALNPAEDDEAILLFGRGDAVPNDMILLDEDATLSITATQGLSAGDGTLETTEDADTEATIDLADLVTITSGGAATFAITTNGSRGTASLDGSILSYTPDEDEFGDDTIVYTATNSEGSSSGTIDVTIDPVNDEPVAQNDTATTQEETPVVIDVLQNDETGADNEDDALFVTEPTGGAANGTVEISDGGSTVTYTPDAGFVGTDSFTYTLRDRDDAEGKTDEGTVTVTVEEAPDTIAAGNGVLNTTEDDTTPVTINLRELVTVISGGEPSFSIQTDGSRGTASLDGSTLSYVPDDDEFGSDTVVYTATNEEGSDSGTINVTIDPLNDPPVANPDSASTDEDTPVDIPVLDNDDTGATNEDDALSVSDATDGANGTTTVNGDGTVTYTPDDDFHGTDSFTYTVSDGDATDTASVTITVNPVNDPPVANPDSATTDEEESVTIEVLDNDTTGADDEDDTLSVVDASDGENGTTSVNGDGTITYTPDTDFFGTDSFTYTLSDGTNTSQGTVTVTVDPVNDAPVAVDDTDSTVKNTPVVIDVLANDSPGAPNEDDVLFITETGDAANGTIEVNDDGTITYTPATDFTGTDSFTYTVSDDLETAQGTVTVTVNDFEPSTLAGSVFFDHIENIDAVTSDDAEPVRNGVKDDDETGLGTSPVRLVSPADQNITGERIELTTYTRLDGSYEFENVVPGTYEIVYDIPNAIVYGREVGDVPGGSANDGVIEVNVGAEGGVSASGLNFTLLATGGSSNGGSAINQIEMLASSYIDNSSGDGEFRGGLVSLEESGEQNWFKPEAGFEGVQFAELTFNDERDAALLTVVEEDGSIKTANVSEDRFVVSSDGTAAAFFGGLSDFNFVPSDDDDVREGFENYREAIDRILAASGNVT